MSMTHEERLRERATGVGNHSFTDADVAMAKWALEQIEYLRAALKQWALQEDEE